MSNSIGLYIHIPFCKHKCPYCDFFSGNADENALLTICGSCEQGSTHPVAESITSYCREKNLALVSPEKSEELAGRGVSSELNSKKILCGNERLMAENGIKLPANLAPTSGSVVYVAVDGNAVGRVVVSDTIKKTSRDAMKKLRYTRNSAYLYFTQELQFWMQLRG